MIDKKIDLYNDCVGCHACSNICPENCISMIADKDGFLFPKVDYDLCISCEQCVDVCPILKVKEIDNKPSAYACINKDDLVRSESSSGGVFTLVAEYVLDNKGYVFGASFNDEFELEHVHINTKDQLSRLRGSKYLQSKIGNSYNNVKTFLDSNKLVLFTGTPCQIAGLKSYLGNKDYDNLLTIDIVCHGVPSPKVWNKYLNFRKSKANSSLKKVSFRNKKDGWKGYSVLFLFDNTEYQKSHRDDLYIKAFLTDVCLRKTCYNCNFKSVNRQSDLTLADFWGIQNVLPEMDDDKGTSLIFINSQKAHDIFIALSNAMIFKQVDINEAVKYNPSAISSVKENPCRNNFFRDLDTVRFDKLVKKYCKKKLSLKTILYRLLRKLKVISILQLFKRSFKTSNNHPLR